MLGYCTLALAAAASFSIRVLATDCNPVEETSCDANTGLTSSTYSVDFTSGADDDNWESVGGGDVEYTESGAEFTITEKGDSPTLQTSWYIFFGRVEIHMKVATGTGIVSCAILLSDVFDEVDWEWLGGYPDEVQTNYFGKGVSTSSGRSTTEAVDDSQNTSHNYTLYWTEEYLSWYLDGSLLRTVSYADASGGDEFPQTPSRVKLGIWAGGDSDNAEGTISWAGGETDYDDGPYTMIVESVEITNFNPAESYTYSDQSGDYASIEFDVASDSDDTSDTNTSTRTSTSTSTSTTSVSTTSAIKSSTTTAPTSVAVASNVIETSSATQSASHGSDSSNAQHGNTKHSNSRNGKTTHGGSSHNRGKKSSGKNSNKNGAKTSGKKSHTSSNDSSKGGRFRD